ncbi:MAG: cytochrome d ubiquinol oxidase subunit II, partial [Polyangiaceae bacterium]
PFALVALGGAVVTVRALRKNEELQPFVGSALFLAGTLLAGAAALFPMLLRSSVDPLYSLDAAHAASGSHGLRVALVWFTPAITLAVVYLVMVLRATRGKADGGAHDG